MIPYHQGNPLEDGVYACMVGSSANRPHVYRDVFLYWDMAKGEWKYLNNVQPFPGCVAWWVGPLHRVPHKEQAIPYSVPIVPGLRLTVLATGVYLAVEYENRHQLFPLPHTGLLTRLLSTLSPGVVIEYRGLVQQPVKEPE